MLDIPRLLSEYNVDFHKGFLPANDPLLALPKQYQAWEDLAANFTAYINAGVIRERIDELPNLEDLHFNSTPELERAMLLLSYFAHAYVHLSPDSRSYIPESISIPWINVTQELKRNPILSHSTIVLYNWRRLDPAKPIQMDNLATLCQFHGGLDESWFYLITVEIEQVGAKAIPLLLEVINQVEQEDYTAAANTLEQALEPLQAITKVLERMYENCDPHIFYLRVRPFLASFEKIEYRGTNLPLQSYHGGSAAQSSLLQFFDAALGIQYEQKATKDYLRLMRDYMPYKHAAFLNLIDQKSTIAEHVHKDDRLAQVYKAAVEALVQFRNEHLKIVALYIIKQASKNNSSAKGTGGTNPMVFLKSVRNQNSDLLE